LTTVKDEGMRILTINLSLPATAKVTEVEAKQVLVLKLVDEGILSQSEAAEALGLSRAEVIELMGKYHIPIMRYSPRDWEQESQVLEELNARRKGRSH